MKILVTGGSGYFGTVLIEKLLEDGHRVIVFDLVEPYSKEVEFLKGNLKDLSTLKPILNSLDAIIHLAALGLKACSQKPDLAVEINFLATKRLVKLANEYKISKFIFSSTCSVYGVKWEICTEETEPEPINVYGLTKLASEQEILKLKEKGVILRLATLFGYSPRMRYDLLVNNYIKQGKSEGKITVHGKELNRPFLHVEDAADAFLTCLKKEVSGIFNLASVNLRLEELAKIISDELGCKIEYSDEVTDRRSYRVSWEKAEKFLDFKPKKTIEDAIQEIEV